MSTSTAQPVTLRIPTPLRAYAEEQSSVQVEGNTVGEALQALTRRFPALKPHLYTEEGKLRSFVNIYLGDEDTRFLQGSDTPIEKGDELSLVPSVAGG